jgi:NAD(P)H-flavin reductase/ferredoxin
MMRKVCKVFVNGEEFAANCGDLLLDAALMNGIDIPHDCRSGYCGTCSVNVVKGRVYGGQDHNANVVQACQCRVISDLAVEIEDVPQTVKGSGQVVELVRLAPTVMEVSIAMPRPIAFLPGQYYKVQFRGFPARCYSPTFPVEGVPDASTLRFQVSQVANGQVSSALGREIGIGHRVKLTGPLGTAYLRPNHPGRVVLVASGTGFAPIWSIALAAIVERRNREMVVIAGARTVESLYMVRALCNLARFSNVTIIPVVSETQTISNAVRTGRPTDYMPTLSPTDVVYTAGAPAMVESVARMASAAGAKCYTDPFAPEKPQSKRSNQRSFLNRAMAWYGRDGARPDMTRSIQKSIDTQINQQGAGG